MALVCPAAARGRRGRDLHPEKDRRIRSRDINHVHKIYHGSCVERKIAKLTGDFLLLWGHFSFIWAEFTSSFVINYTKSEIYVQRGVLWIGADTEGRKVSGLLVSFPDRIELAGAPLWRSSQNDEQYSYLRNRLGHFVKLRIRNVCCSVRLWEHVNVSMSETTAECFFFLLRKRRFQMAVSDSRSAGRLRFCVSVEQE